MADSLKKRRKRHRFIKNTPQGKRAIAGAKAGRDHIHNPDGSKSSILTATFGVGIDGKERTIIVPTIVKDASGNIRRLTRKQALARALKTGDHATAKSLRVAERRSNKFSRRLGRISRKRGNG